MILAKRYFTILEMLIVIALIGLVSGIIGISINRALNSQRFRSEVAQIVTTLRLAQDLMLVVQADVTILFAEEKGKGFRVWLETESPLDERWEKDIQRTKRTLTKVESISFRDAQTGALSEGNIELRFFSNGSVMSQGVLRMIAPSIQSAICLPGFPAPLNSTQRKDVRAFCQEDTQFNTRLTEMTVRAIKPPEDEEDEKS